MLRSNDADVSFSMSESASPSQSSIVVEDCWPSEKGRGLPKPMRWSSQPRKKERKVKRLFFSTSTCRARSFSPLPLFLSLNNKKNAGGRGYHGGARPRQARHRDCQVVSGVAEEAKRGRRRRRRRKHHQRRRQRRQRRRRLRSLDLISLFLHPVFFFFES